MSSMAHLLDTIQIGAVLARGVFEEEVTCCRILHVRSKPGCAWIGSYAVKCGGRAEERIVSIRGGEPSGSVWRYNKSAALGQDVRYLAELDAVAWMFPSDRKLTGLPKLIESGMHFEDAPTRSQEIIHYMPERSCVVRLEFFREDAQRPSAIVFGKAYADGLGAQTFHFMSQLWNGGEDGLRIARPLLYDAEHAILWQLGLSGVRLNLHSEEELAGAGRALAALHRRKVANLPPGVSFEQRLQADGEVLLGFEARNQNGLRELLERLCTLAPRLDGSRRVTIHGDLHPKNFLAGDDRVAIIDLDTLAYGSPLEDLASFGAALLAAGLAAGREARKTEEKVDTFLEAYQTAAGWRVRPFDWNWGIAAALLVERSLRAITRPKHGSAQPADLIALAAEFLADAERGINA